MSITPLTPEEVRAFRAAKGWTQAKMAAELGVAKRTLELWENRAVNPGAPAKSAPPAYLRHALTAMLLGIAPCPDLVAAVAKAADRPCGPNGQPTG